MNLGDAKKQIAMIIDAYSERGDVTSSTADNVADIYLKMPAYLDMAQKKISESHHIKKSFKVSHIMPFDAKEWQFKTYTHTTEDIVFSVALAYAYCFKVDSEADIYIEGIDSAGDATELAMITGYSNGGFTIFKDLIYIPTGTTYSSIQIRFSGSNTYNITDICLFESPISNYSLIPDFGRFISYSMPTDFRMALKAEIHKPEGYEKLTNYTWENPTTLSISICQKGEVRIEYAAIPTTVTNTTADTYEFEVPYPTHTALVLYAAALIIQKEDYAQYQLLMQNYTETMANINSSYGLQHRQSVVKKVY